MALYPSLEDMAVGKMMEAQLSQQNPHRSALHTTSSTPTFVQVNPDIPAPGAYPAYPGAAPPSLPGSGFGSTHHGSPSGGAGYPSLGEYMGLTPEVLQSYLPFPNVSPTGHSNGASAMVPAYPSATPSNVMLAPVTGNAIGLRRAEVTHGIRQVILCKDAQGKAGLRFHAVNNGVFVSFVMKDSPAALAGLRFGDQILQIENENCAGWSTDQATKKLTKAAGHSITMAVRDRPFERTITMHKDSSNRVGFGYKDGKIEKIVKDSSAARNGILTEHNVLEVNGQNVIGMKDKDVLKLLEDSPSNVTITIMPTTIFQHIVKNMSSDLIRKSMDHSVPFI